MKKIKERYDNVIVVDFTNYTCSDCEGIWGGVCCGDPVVCGRFPNEYTEAVDKQTLELDRMMHEMIASVIIGSVLKSLGRVNL